MALSVARAQASLKATTQRPRAAVRPVARIQAQQAAKIAIPALASVAFAAAFAAAPAEAHNVISTVASATEGYPFVPPSWAPSVLVPFTGLILPAIAMGTLFVWIEKEAPRQG